MSLNKKVAKNIIKAQVASDNAKDIFELDYEDVIMYHKKEECKMKYEVILEKGKYALILRGSRMEEYAVVNGLNKETGEWSWTCCYYNFGNYTQIDKTQALFLALDYFRMRTETNYIPRCRLEELAMQFKDGLIKDDEESAMEYFNKMCEMSDEEKEFFGIETESEEE